MVSVEGAYSSVKTLGWKLLSQRQRDLAAKQPFTYRREVRIENTGTLLEVRPGDNAAFTTDGYLMVNMGSIASKWGGSGMARTFPFPDLGAKAKALAKVQKKIAAGVADLADADQANLAVNVAERKQAADMLVKRTRQLLSAAKAINKGYLFEAWRQMSSRPKPLSLKDKIKASNSNLANLWLEYQYGWKPLVSDIYGAAEQIARSYRDLVPYRFVGSHQSVVEGKSFVVQTLNSSIGGSQWNELADYTYLERARYVIEAVVDNDTLHALSQTGITNPLLLAWEIVPYSFVIDWFLPVGNYLEQLSYAQGLVFKSGTFSLRRSGMANTWMSKANNLGWPASLSKKPSRSVVLTSKERSVLASFPYQDFPHFQPHLGVERALSAISLLSQTFGRSPRQRLR